MADKLSATMIDVLRTAITRGGELEYRYGGFWTWPNCPTKKTDTHNGRSYEIPEWSCEFQTIAALEKRGYMVVEKRNGFPYRARVAAKALQEGWK